MINCKWGRRDNDAEQVDAKPAFLSRSKRTHSHGRNVIDSGDISESFREWSGQSASISRRSANNRQGSSDGLRVGKSEERRADFRSFEDAEETERAL